MTVKEIFKVVGIKVPKNIDEKREVEVVSGFLPHVVNRFGIFFDIYDMYVEKQNINLVKKTLDNGSIVITNKEYLDESGKELPVIKVKNPDEKYIIFGNYLRKIKKAKVIAITGSFGKSTTVRMATYVFSEKYKVFTSNSTSNYPQYFVGEMYTHLNEDYDFHIQETGASWPGLVENSARILDADAFCLTNINSHHIDKYGSIDNLIKDKISYDVYSKKEAIGVLNADDEKLFDLKYKHKMITFGIKNKKADYIAKNIKYENDTLVLDIYAQRKKEVTIKVKIVGEHNVYNILAVYALAKAFDLTNEEIVNGFAKYQSTWLRQNVRTICGRKIYIDCFNVCTNSIKSCLNTLEKFDLPKGSKRIAILGGENALGEEIYTHNYNFGQELVKYKKIDKFICVGTKSTKKETINFLGDGKALYEGAKTVLPKDKLAYYDDIEKLGKFIEKETKPGDAILLKGIFRLPLIGAIDLTFGTAYVINMYFFYKNSQKVKSKYFEGRIIKALNKVDLTKALDKNSQKIIIPSKINKHVVLHLQRAICRKAQMKVLKIGKNLRSVSDLAFNGCPNLKKVVIPGNVKVIGVNAFSNCSSLKVVKIKEGTLEINAKAFSNCPQLEKVYLPKSLVSIGQNAFPNRKRVKFITYYGSYANRHLYKNYKWIKRWAKGKILKKIKRKIMKVS